MTVGMTWLCMLIDQVSWETDMIVLLKDGFEKAILLNDRCHFSLYDTCTWNMVLNTSFINYTGELLHFHCSSLLPES